MRTPLRIGLVGQDWAPTPGGVEGHCAGLARELASLGCAVHALALERDARRPAGSARDSEVDGVPVRRVVRDDRAERPQDHLRRPAQGRALLAWVRRVRPDLVHLHHLSGWGSGVLGELADLGVPTVVTVHDHWLWCPRGQSFRDDGTTCARPEPAACGTCLGACASDAARRTELALADLARAGRVLAPSRSVQEALTRAGFDGRRVEILPPGVDGRRLEREVRNLRPLCAPQDGRRHLGVLGSVLPSKGVLALARAVFASRRTDLVLDVHGPRPDYHGSRVEVEALERLARDTDRVRLCGPYDRTETARVLATLDGVAVPSRWEEAYGLGAREARAAGLPVLASDLGGLAELRGDPGVLLLDPRDERAWAEALRSHPLRPVACGPEHAPPELAEVAQRLLEGYRRQIDRTATAAQDSVRGGVHEGDTLGASGAPRAA